MGQIRLRMLGDFSIEVGGRVIDETTFERPQAASLVKLLALADGRRLHREQVIDALWPDAGPAEGAPRLHKISSYVRSATGDKGAISMRDQSVMLWPGNDVWIDVEVFKSAASADPHAAADLYRGDLLPGDIYAEWSTEARGRLRLLYLEVLRSAGRWQSLLDAEPADEQAHIELMHGFAVSGQRLATLRQYERLERALNDELGVTPSLEAREIRRQAVHARSTRLDLVGRSAEQSVLRDALDDAALGSGSFVLLTGPAGIGKSALGNWIVDRARDDGWRIGQAVAASVDGPWPYASMIEVVEDLVRQSPELLDELPPTHLTEIRRVRDAPASVNDGPGDEGHQRLFVSVDRLARHAAAARGLLIFVDDLHTADDGSLSLFHYIARQATRQRLVLVATARTGVASPAFDEVRALVGRKGAREVRVGPLDPQDSSRVIRSIVEHPLDDADLSRLVELSGGMPFYLEELARSVGSGLSAIPDHVATIVTASLAGLPNELRDALTRVAIAGIRFDTDQFIALTGTPEDVAFELLDRALDLEIIAYASGGYHFRHALVRDSLLSELAPHRRRLAHRDAADRLDRMNAPPAQIAHHLIAAADHGRAAPWALRAAKAAHSVGALNDTVTMIDRVLDHADPDTRFELLMLRADAMAGMGDPSAVAAFQLALREARGPSRQLIRAKMARASMMSGDIESARTILAGLLPDGGPFDGPVLFATGLLAYMTGDLESAERAASEARTYALKESAPTRMLDALTLQGMVAHSKGEWFDRMRTELTSTATSTELAMTIFDCHL